MKTFLYQLCYADFNIVWFKVLPGWTELEPGALSVIEK